MYVGGGGPHIYSTSLRDCFISFIIIITCLGLGLGLGLVSGLGVGLGLVLGKSIGLGVGLGSQRDLLHEVVVAAVVEDGLRRA